MASNKKIKLPMFYLTKADSEKLKAMKEETGQPMRELVQAMLSSYAIEPFDLKKGLGEWRGEGPLVDEKTKSCIEEEADKAGLTVSSATRQIVESFLENETMSPYLRVVKRSVEGA